MHASEDIWHIQYVKHIFVWLVSVYHNMEIIVTFKEPGIVFSDKLSCAEIAK